MKTILHFLKGPDHKNQVHDELKDKITIKHKHSHALEIHYNNKDQHDNLIKKYQNDPNIAIFYDNKDIRCKKGIRKPHFRKHTSLTNKTIRQIANYYNFPQVDPTLPQQKIAIISMGGTYSTSDLESYWNLQGQTIKPIINYVDVDGATNGPNQQPQENDGTDENMLDLEVVGGLAQNAIITIMFCPNSDTGEYDCFHQAMENGNNIISTSWGGPENPEDKTNMLALDQLFQNYSGVICAASGDSGSSDGIDDGQLHVDFPASSPNVISCGGSSLYSDTEKVWNNGINQGAAGGGQSIIFSLPSYQALVAQSTQEVIKNNVHRNSPDTCFGCADPRSGPTIIINGQQTTIGGTSVIAPMMAAYVALTGIKITHEMLYSAYKTDKSIFNVITGDNDTVRFGRYSKGYWVSDNWYNCASGLGSFDGTKLLNAIKSLNLPNTNYNTVSKPNHLTPNITNHLTPNITNHLTLNRTNIIIEDPQIPLYDPFCPMTPQCRLFGDCNTLFF